MIAVAPAGAASAAPLKEWDKSYGGETANGMVALSDGYALVGANPYSGNGGGDLYLVRTDLSGNKLWSKTYGGAKWDYGYGIAPAGDGFVLVGVTQSFDSAGNEDIYLLKTDANGNVIWQKNIGGPLEEVGYGITAIKDGFIITGKAETSTGYDYIYLAKIDQDGKVVWQQQYPGPKDQWGTMKDSEGRYVLPVSDGYVVVGEKWAGGLLMLKTDLDGNLLWLKDLGLDAEGRSIVAAADGYVIAGHGRYLTGGNGSEDVLLAKTDKEGNLQWTRVFGGKENDDAYSVLPVDGGYVVAGDLTNAKGIYEAYLFRTDLSGNMIWNATYGGSDDEHGYVLLKVPDGGYVIAGRSGNGGAMLLKTYPEGSAGAKPSPLPARQVPSGTAPGIAWNKTFGGTGFDNINDIIAVSDGYIGTGVTEANTGNQELTIFKTDKSGKLLWQSNYSSHNVTDMGFSILPAGDGYVVMGDSWTGDDAHTCLLKFDLSGKLLWSRTLDSNAGFDHLSTCIAAKDGYLLVGTTDSDQPGHDFEKYVLLMKTDLNGNEQWIKTISAAYPQGGHDAVAVSDGYVITGDTARSMVHLTDELGNTRFAPAHEQDVSLVKVDLNGNLVWQKYFSSPYVEYGNSIASAGDGFVIAGYLGDQDGKNGSVFLMKTDASGKQLWQKTYGAGDVTTPGDMVAESNGYVVAGQTKDGNAVAGDVYLMKADLDGNLLWQTAFDTPGSAMIDAVIADGGRYVLAGYLNEPYGYSSVDEGSDSYLLAVAPGRSSSPATSTTSSGPDCCCLLPVVLVILLIAAGAGYWYWKKGGKTIPGDKKG